MSFPGSIVERPCRRPRSSAARGLRSAPTTGIEVLTYDLELDGVLGDLIPEDHAGRFTVEELVDHDHEGRYRIVKLTSDGQIVGGAADDSLRGTRVRYMRADGRRVSLEIRGRGTHGVVGSGVEAHRSSDTHQLHADEQHTDATRGPARRRRVLSDRHPRWGRWRAGPSSRSTAPARL